MSDFIALTCPSCGADLKIDSKSQTFTCGHCGKQFLVKQSGGALSIIPIVEGIRNVQTGVDKTASELAIKRLQKEIRELEDDLQGIKSLDGEQAKKGLEMIGAGALLMLFFGSIDVGIAPVLFFSLLVIAGIVMLVSALSGKNKDKINAMTQELNQKRSMLRHHKNIVNKI